MKVLVVSGGLTRIPVEFGGGIEEHVWKLSSALSRLGHKAIVIDRYYSQEDKYLEDCSGIEIRRISAPLLRSPKHGQTLGKRTYAFRSILNSIIYGLCLSKSKVLESADVITSFETLQTFCLTIFGGKNTRSKLFYVYSSPSWPPGMWLGRLQTVSVFPAKIITDCVLRRVRSVIAQNDDLKKKLVIEAKVDPRRIAIVTPGVDFEKLIATSSSRDLLNVEKTRRKYGSPKFLVLFVGRIHPQKGLEYLVRSVDILVNEFKQSNVKLVVAGPDDQFDARHLSRYRLRIQQLVNNLGLNHYIAFTGAVARKDLMDLYRSCDVFVLPSLSETYGLVVSEAMVFGKPVIGSNVSGIAMQLSDGVNGFLVQPKDARAIAKRLKYLFDNPDVRSQMGKNASLSAEKRDWKNIAQKFVHAYENIPPT